MADQKITALTATTLIDDADVLVMSQSPFGAGSNRKFTGSTLRTQLGFTTGILGQAAGGTGIDTSTATDGQLLIGGTLSNDLQLATLTGTTDQVIVTNGTNSVTLSLPQSINTTSSPTFTNLTLSGTLNVDGNAINSTGAITVTPTAGNDLSVVLSGAGDFVVNTNDLFVDTSSGNVGINLTNPADRLHISDTAGVANQLRVSGTAPAINMHTTAGDISRMYVETTAGQLTSGTSIGDLVFSNLDGRIHFGPSGGTVRLIMSGTNIDVTNSATLRILSGNTLNVLSGGTGSIASGGTLNVLSGATFTTRTITTTSGELTVTPFAGSNLNIALSGLGNFAINTSTFFVDGNQLRVGIGTATPPSELFILKGGVQVTPNADTIAVFQSSGDAAIDVVAGNAFIGALKFGDVDNVQIGRIEYDHTVNSMELFTNNSPRVHIDSGGQVAIGSFVTPDVLLHVITDETIALPALDADAAFVVSNTASNTADLSHVAMHLIAGSQSESKLFFGDNGNSTVGAIRYDHVDNSMHFDGTSVADRMVIDAAGIITKPFQPSFFAHNSATDTNVTGNGEVFTVICNTEAFDLNGDYNTTTGVFTAPVTGKYEFFVTVFLEDLNSAHTIGILSIISSNRTVRVQDLNVAAVRRITSDFLQLSGSAFVDMDASDTCSITIDVRNGTTVVDVIGEASGLTSFAGSLIN